MTKLSKKEYKELEEMGYGLDKHREENPEVYLVLGSVWIIILLFLIIPTLISLVGLIIWFNKIWLFIFGIYALLSLIFHVIMRLVTKYIYTSWLKEKGIEIL